MDQEKIVENCPKCNNALRFPVTTKKIRFLCPSCKMEYFAVNGHILEPEKEIIDDHVPIEEVPEPLVKDPVVAKKPTKKKQRPAPEDNEAVNISNAKLKNYWPWVAAVLFLAVLVLSFLDIFRYREQDRLTAAMLSSLKPGSGHDIEFVERNMTAETRNDFKLLLESQYNSGDSVAAKQADHFFNTLEPMDYFVSRKFRYLTSKNDTAYFTANYVTRHDSILLEVDLPQFLK